MEKWIHWLRSLAPNHRQRDQLAQTIALKAQRPVWQRIAPRVLEMSHFEARGYVQARARLVIADQLRSYGPLTPLRYQQLQHAALQQVVVWAVTEAGRQRRTRYLGRAA